MKRKRLIAVALIVCATIVLVAVAIIRYANYATNDGFCVGAGGKLIKVGL
jgi:flagellar basal body-associated protein FliL